MTLPASGAISINDILIELGRPSGSTIDVNDPDIYTLADKTQGTPIIFPTDFYGKSFVTEYSKTFTAGVPLITTVGMTSGDLGANGPDILINGNGYKLTTFRQASTLALTIGIEYGANPDFSGTGVELTINIGGSTIRTNGFAEGGGATGINWVIHEDFVDGLSMIEGNQYTLDIVQTAGTGLDVTVGTIALGSIYGYKNAGSLLLFDAAGSIEPTTVGGATVSALYVVSTNNRILIELEGSHAEDAFDTITFRSDQVGNPLVTKSFLNDNIDYTNIGSHTRWTFTEAEPWFDGFFDTVVIN